MLLKSPFKAFECPFSVFERTFNDFERTFNVFERRFNIAEYRKTNEGVSLFIGIRGIIGTLTTFLGLLTDFKRKLDLTVVVITPKAGTLMR